MGLFPTKEMILILLKTLFWMEQSLLNAVKEFQSRQNFITKIKQTKTATATIFDSMYIASYKTLFSG